MTPSWNQARFIEETIDSILSQSYPNLEYIIIDGGSTDGSVDIIKKYSHRLAYWQSQKDGGQYHAIQEGFKRSSGEIMAWVNSDDKLLPWSLQTVGEVFASQSSVEWLTSLFPFGWEESGKAATCRATEGYSADQFWLGHFLPGREKEGYFAIQQESTFWRRSLWDRTGGLDLSVKLAGDFDLWARFFKAGATLHGVGVPLGGFRHQQEQRSLQQYAEYVREAEASLERHGRRTLSRWEQYKLERARKRQAYWRRKEQKLVRKSSSVKVCLHACRADEWQVHSK
ncbi:MAG: glycosyltransferase family 2 protein [Verrucomicrobiales bacterium]